MIPEITILAPYIAAARRNVGKHRTDPDDIARILRDHGATCTLASLAIETALRDHYADVVEPASLRIGGAIVTLDRYTVPSDMSVWVYNPAYVAPQDYAAEHAAVASAIQSRQSVVPGFTLPVDRPAAIRCAADQWFRDNSETIQALCVAEAAALLADREVAA